jgi:putative copper export protein
MVLAFTLMAMLAVPSALLYHPWSPLHKDQIWQVRMFAAFGIISAVQGAMPWIVGARLGRRLALNVTQR